VVIVTREAARNLRNQAEALAIGLDLEVLRVDDVAAWARQTVDAGRGDVALSRVASMVGCDAARIACALRLLPGVCDRGVAEVLLVRRLLDMRSDDPVRAKAMLCKLVLSYVVHELRPAAEGYYGQKSSAGYYGGEDVTFAAEDGLVAACEALVETSESILDPVDGSQPPSWLRRPT
jgi:hypothetical protein